MERAARIGDAWYATAGATPESLAQSMEIYRNAGGTRAVARVDALVLDDGDEARSTAADLVEAGYRGMRMDQLIVGSPDDAAARVDTYGEAGFDDLIVRAISVPQVQALETIEHLAALNTG